MFTTAQIKQAHGKVKSGADFPAYIKEIKTLGVTSYEAYVTDGHIDYFGSNNYQVSTPAKYEAISIASHTDADQFKADLKAHQQGKTDYPTFCSDCAKSGIVKWAVNMEKMTCTYYGTTGEEVLVELIPQ
jgi:uncharacterized protein YbcV (DUF1398 family)